MTALSRLFCCLSMILLFGAQMATAQTRFVDRGLVTSVSVLEDRAGTLTIDSVVKRSFNPEKNIVPNYGLTGSVYWFKIEAKNDRHWDDLFLKVHSGILKTVDLFVPVAGTKGYTCRKTGEAIPYTQKEYNTQFPVFRLNIPDDSVLTVWLRVSSNNVMEVPISVAREYSVWESINKDQLFFGIYIGIICVMFFYNIFIFITVRDSSYLYYVLYIITVGLVQACLKGYASKYLWRENTWLTIQMTNIALALSGITAIFFLFRFLGIKENRPKLFRVFQGILALYFVGIAINLSGRFVDAQKLIQGTASLVSFTIMFAGISIYRKGYKPALYLTIAWSFFLTGVIVYILKDAGVLPYNGFTSNAILIGSAFEVALLSFALADKINTYRKEKDQARANELALLMENEKLVREQNVVLERKVKERTQELDLSNQELNKALIDLKEAETQLVESEKMASLGQLTAGIAHEINNPINFVTSNIRPLNRDVAILLEAMNEIEQIGLTDENAEEKKKKVAAYKEEIDFEYLKEEIGMLLNGIGEGANRTQEIVKGLRVFSRLDEDDLKKANVNEGIESTLVICNNLLGHEIIVEKNFGNLPLVECYPGKLNQVFLNIISNAAYAIKKKFNSKEGGKFTVTTTSDEHFVYISMVDNGTGMDENTKKKLFEPFFTTKEVGEGTGLGMSIAYNTIIKHNGQVIVNTELGKGTEFIIKLPLIQKSA